MTSDPETSATPADEAAARSRRTPVLIGLATVGAVMLGYAVGTHREVEKFPEDSAVKTKEQPDGSAVSASGSPAPAAAAVTARPAPAPVEEKIRGIVNASSESTVASRMTARIIAMPYADGEAFRAGAVLVRFDCASTAAQLRAAEAASAAYRKTYETQVELDSYEATGKNEVAVSRANLGKADAEAKAISAQMTDCEVRAPFSGKVVERLARRNDIAASGQALLKIQSGTALEIELIVPSRWLTWVGPGAAFSFIIDETGKSVRGRVQRLGAAVDPVSKTIKVIGVITQQDGLILAGMSGSAIFDDPRAGQGGQAPTATTSTATTPSTTAAPAAQTRSSRHG